MILYIFWFIFRYLFLLININTSNMQIKLFRHFNKNWQFPNIFNNNLSIFSLSITQIPKIINKLTKFQHRNLTIGLKHNKLILLLSLQLKNNSKIERIDLIIHNLLTFGYFVHHNEIFFSRLCLKLYINGYFFKWRNFSLRRKNL